MIGRLFAFHDLSWEKTIDQMKSEFISVASHELRTPMTSIKGSVDLILAGCAGEISPPALELLEVAQSGCDRMIRLISNILDLSKIEAGQIQLRLDLLDLGTVVERSLRSMRPLADQAGITLKSSCTSEIPQVEADSDRMEQVITNLVSNAIKFSPANAEVEVNLSADDGLGSLQRIGSRERNRGKGSRAGFSESSNRPDFHNGGPVRDWVWRSRTL